MTLRTSSEGGGFTLIELVFVMVILSILLAATLPRFSQTAQRLRTEQSAFEWTQLLRYAHVRAAAQGQEVIWRWDPSIHRAYLETVQNGEVTRLQERTAQSASLTAEASVGITQADQPVDCQCVHFFPNGTSEPTTVTLTFRKHVYTLHIDEATGQACLATGTAAC